MSDKKITQKSTQPTSSYTSTYNVGNAGSSMQPTTGKGAAPTPRAPAPDKND